MGKTCHCLDGGTSVLAIANRALVETTFEASKTLYSKAFHSLKSCIEYHSSHFFTGSLVILENLFSQITVTVTVLKFG